VVWVQCVEVLLEKFREKKPAVVQALKDAVDAVYCTVRAIVNTYAAAAAAALCCFVYVLT